MRNNNNYKKYYKHVFKNAKTLVKKLSNYNNNKKIVKDK